MHSKKIKIVLLASALVAAACQKAEEEASQSANTPASTGAATETAPAPAEPTEPAPLAKQAAEVATQDVTVVGQNYCLGCSLKKAEGVAAQCSKYGHRHALRVENASAANGGELPQLGGQTLHYLDNDASAELLTGEELHAKRVEVSGKLFGPERTLEVREIKKL